MGPHEYMYPTIIIISLSRLATLGNMVLEHYMSTYVIREGEVNNE